LEIFEDSKKNLGSGSPGAKVQNRAPINKQGYYFEPIEVTDGVPGETPWGDHWARARWNLLLLPKCGWPLDGAVFALLQWVTNSANGNDAALPLRAMRKSHRGLWSGVGLGFAFGFGLASAWRCPCGSPHEADPSIAAGAL